MPKSTEIKNKNKLKKLWMCRNHWSYCVECTSPKVLRSRRWSKKREQMMEKRARKLHAKCMNKNMKNGAQKGATKTWKIEANSNTESIEKRWKNNAKRSDTRNMKIHKNWAKKGDGNYHKFIENGSENQCKFKRLGTFKMDAKWPQYMYRSTLCLSAHRVRVRWAAGVLELCL